MAAWGEGVLLDAVFFRFIGSFYSLNSKACLFETVVLLFNSNIKVHFPPNQLVSIGLTETYNDGALCDLHFPSVLLMES